MAKKEKKKEIIEEEIEDEEERQEEKDLDMEDLEDNSLSKNYGGEEDGDDEEISDVPETSMEIGGQIHKQDQMFEIFKQLPKDLKYSFFDKWDKLTVINQSDNYKLFFYLKKNQFLSQIELERKEEKYKEFFNMKKFDEIRDYFINNKNIYFILKHLSKEDKEALEKIHEENSNFLEEYDDLLNEEDIKAYEQELKEKTKNKENLYFEDDMGILNKILTRTEVSKGYEGKERRSINTTISVTRDENLKEEYEEEGNENISMLQKMKKKFKP